MSPAEVIAPVKVGEVGIVELGEACSRRTSLRPAHAAQSHTGANAHLACGVRGIEGVEGGGAVDVVLVDAGCA